MVRRRFGHLPARSGLVLLVLTSAIGCDQATKDFASQTLKAAPPISLLGDVVRFQYAENTGAIMSFGADLPPAVRTWLFTAGVGLFLAALLVYALAKSELGRASVAGLSLVLGGGVGNLIDRVMNAGAVVDFVTIGWGWFRTAIFNMADLLIFVGAGLLLWEAYRKGGQPRLRRGETRA